MPGPFTINAATLLANDLGTHLKIVAVSQPASGGGSVTLDAAAQTITYNVPPQQGDGSYPSADSFGYTISNLYGNTATATVHITLNNCVPVTTPPPVVIPPPNQPIQAVSDKLSRTYPQSTAQSQEIAIPAATIMSNDTGTTIRVTQVATNSTTAGRVRLDVAAQIVYYTPPAVTVGAFGTNYASTDSFDYTITDNLGQTSQATVTLALSPPISAADDHIAHLNPTQTTLIYSQAQMLTNDAGDKITVTTVGPAKLGSVSLMANGTVQYTPPASTGTAQPFYADNAQIVDQGGYPFKIDANSPLVPGDFAYMTQVIYGGAPLDSGGDIEAGWTLLQDQTEGSFRARLWTRILDQAYLDRHASYWAPIAAKQAANQPLGESDVYVYPWFTNCTIPNNEGSSSATAVHIPAGYTYDTFVKKLDFVLANTANNAFQYTAPSFDEACLFNLYNITKASYGHTGHYVGFDVVNGPTDSSIVYPNPMPQIDDIYPANAVVSQGTFYDAEYIYIQEQIFADVPSGGTTLAGDSFPYTITDTNGSTANATVYLTFDPTDAAPCPVAVDDQITVASIPANTAGGWRSSLQLNINYYLTSLGYKTGDPVTLCGYTIYSSIGSSTDTVQNPRVLDFVRDAQAAMSKDGFSVFMTDEYGRDVQNTLDYTNIQNLWMAVTRTNPFIPDTSGLPTQLFGSAPTNYNSDASGKQWINYAQSTFLGNDLNVSDSTYISGVTQGQFLQTRLSGARGSQNIQILQPTNYGAGNVYGNISSDSFQYFIADASGCVSNATVTVTVNNGSNCDLNQIWAFYNDNNQIGIGKDDGLNFKLHAGDLLVYIARQATGAPDSINRANFTPIGDASTIESSDPGHTYEAGYWILTQTDVDALYSDFHVLTTGLADYVIQAYTTQNGTPMPSGAVVKPYWEQAYYGGDGSIYTPPKATAYGLGVLVYFNLETPGPNSGYTVQDFVAQNNVGDYITGNLYQQEPLTAAGAMVFSAVIQDPCGPATPTTPQLG